MQNEKAMLLDNLAKKYQFFKVVKVRYIKKKIATEGYYNERMDIMNTEIQSWMSSYKEANTRIERNFCLLMINMYLKRYQFYVNK